MPEIEQATVNERAWEQLEAEAPERGVLTFSGESLQSYPDPARWRVHRCSCDPTPAPTRTPPLQRYGSPYAGSRTPTIDTVRPLPPSLLERAIRLERHDHRGILPALFAASLACRSGLAQETRDLLDMTAVEAYAPAHVVRRRPTREGPQKIPELTGDLSGQWWRAVHHAANVRRAPLFLLLASMIISCKPILSQWRAVAFVLVGHIADATGAVMPSTR